jgi:hypothetical protein
MKHPVAYNQGFLAAMNGWERISPYKGLKAEGEWYQGYDAVMKKYGECHRESGSAIQQLIGRAV